MIWCIALTMTALSSGSYDITSTSGISFSSSTSQSVTTTSYTNQTVTYQLISGSSYISDAKFLVSSQSFLTIIENTYIELSPDLTCSTLGSTSITYSIENYNGETAPSWVVINSTSGVLKVTAPSVSSASTYSFYASSFVSGATGQVQKVITLQVNKWTVQNCKTWSSSSGSIWVSWNSQYVLNSNVCNYHRTVTPTLEAVAAETTATVTVVATVSVVVVSQMLNASSVCTIWSVVNLIQSLFYLLLLRVYLPDDVYFFIMGMKVALFPFDIFKFKTTSTSTSVTSLLDFDQPDDTLSNIGLDSGSSFVNNYSLFTTLIAYAIFHVYFIVVMKLIRKINIATKFPRWSEITNKFMKKIYYFMTFTIYLRTFIEGYQFLLMSSMFEIHYFTNSSFKHIVSFSIAWAIALLWLALLIFVFLISIFRKPEVIKDDKLGEIFKEIKEKKHSRLYTFQILLKKSFNVALVAYLSFEYSYAWIILMALFQLLYTVFLIIQRPLEEPKSNLIEIINEIFLSILMTWMLYYNNESRWTSTASQSAIWMFWGVNITIFLITAGMNLLLNFSWCCQRNHKDN